MNVKAERLIDEDRVRRATADVYVVQGDTGTYITTILLLSDAPHLPYTGSCTCEHGRRSQEAPILAGDQGCAHLQAAYRLSLERPEKTEAERYTERRSGRDNLVMW